MKKMSLACLLLMLISGAFAQTQQEMNYQAHEEFLKADKNLNKIYQQILKEYKSDTVFIMNLKASQKIWIKFREAEVAMMYPDRPAPYYGSILPMCIFGLKKTLTEARTKTLRQWVNGVEGDACGSSIKPKK